MPATIIASARMAKRLSPASAAISVSRSETASINGARVHSTPSGIAHSADTDRSRLKQGSAQIAASTSSAATVETISWPSAMDCAKPARRARRGPLRRFWEAPYRTPRQLTIVRKSEETSSSANAPTWTGSSALVNSLPVTSAASVTASTPPPESSPPANQCPVAFHALLPYESQYPHTVGRRSVAAGLSPGFFLVPTVLRGSEGRSSIG